MSNSIIKTKIHNRFDIHVEHADGSVDKYTQYNIVLDNLYKKMFRLGHYHQSGNYGYGEWTAYLVYGTGTGEMDASRTTLFEPLGSKASTYVYRRYNSDWRSGEVQMQITIEPNEHVGSTLTEIGIGGTSSAYTHSLIKDSFGNPVAINKTDTDKIIIYATVYAELFDADDIGVSWLSDNALLKYMLGVPPHYYNGSYALYAYNIDNICDRWVTGGTTEAYSTGASVDDDGFIHQSLSLGINSYNGNDIRSLIIGEHHMSYGDKYAYGCVVPIKGPNFEGVTYPNQRVGVGNGEDTVFKIPANYRGVKDCVVKVDNRVVNVKKNMIHGNNRIVGHTGVPGSFVKIDEGKYASIVTIGGSSSNYYGYGIQLYEVNERGRVTRKYSKKIGSADIYYSSSKYMSASIFEELNAITVKNGSVYELYHIDWDTGELIHRGNMAAGNSSETAKAYAISGTNYIAIENTSSSTSYKKTLYEYSNNVITQVKDLAYIPALFGGPNIGAGTLKGDYYAGNKLYKFDTITREFISTATLPFESGKGIVIAPFIIATTQDYPGAADTSQQLVIKKCDSNWSVLETIEFSDKFPKSSSTAHSAIYLKENIFLIGSKEPHIVTFNPDTNEITYRKHTSNLTNSNYNTGFYYKTVMDIPNSTDFIYSFSSLAVCTEQEVGSIEFSEPVAEGSVITIDFTLDYIPKNNSITASFKSKLYWG